MSEELEVIDPEDQPKKKQPKITDAQAVVAAECIGKDGKYDINLVKHKAMALLGKWREEQGLVNVSLETSFHQMSQVDLCQMHMMKFLESDKIDPRTKIMAAAVHVQATRAAIELMDIQRNLVKESGGSLRNEPKNAPPIMDMQVAGDVHVHQAAPQIPET